MGVRLFLCRLDQLADPGSRGFTVDDDGVPYDCFVVRKGGRVFAYRNRCPHTGVPLEWVPHRFLDYDGYFIQCATHGALFAIEDGLCLRGPCAGQGLERLDVELEGDRVMLAGGAD